MNKTCSFIALLLSVQCLFAQPVLNNNLNFAAGDKYRIDGYNDVTTINPGGPGGNQVWDFEVIAGEDFFEGSPAICVDPATTPFADSTQAIQSTIAIKPYESEFGPYQYMKSNANSREILAMGWYETGNTSFSKYLNSYSDLKFPLAHGDVYDFDTEMLMFSVDMGSYFMRDSGHVAVEADAWGAITTPVATYPNVLRLKTTSVMHSWFKYDAGEPWMYLGAFTDISYTWYAPDIKVPVMGIMEFLFDKGGKGMFSAHYLAEYESPTGVRNPGKKPFSLYPNPARNVVSALFEEGSKATEWIIYDQQGQEVMRQRPQHGTLDVSGLKPGFYFVKQNNNQTGYAAKLVIQ